MLLSRFWIVLLTLALGASAFTLLIARERYNHEGTRAMNEALLANSSAVSWFLSDDARTRSSALIKLVISKDVVEGLAKASGDVKIDAGSRAKIKAALSAHNAELDADTKFDSIWAVDANGRIVANVGFDHGEDWELGGYPSVADAIHGWIRDDAWVWKGRIYRVVTRPVEQGSKDAPVGAIIGAKIVDDTFARAVSRRTHAAVGFYADNARVASGAPEGFDKANLDEITSDLKALDADKDYQEKGRSEPRVLGQHLGVVYARMPGEAWELGAGYAVGASAVSVGTHFEFVQQADNNDKAKVPTLWIVLGVLGLIAVGLAFTVAEYNGPLATFRAEALRMAKGEIDVFSPSRFRGAYKRIAADLNDGIEKVAAKGGAPRRAADLEQVLGPIPAQPQMSAFSVPGGPASPGSVESTTSTGPRPVPRPPVSERGAPRLRSGQSGQMQAVSPDDASDPLDVRASAPTPAPATGPKPPPPPKRPTPSPAVTPAAAATPTPPEPAPTPGDDFDELSDWRRVYEEFIALKKQCGEDAGSLTFEKFKGTLQRNKDALVARHNCVRVKFTVYVKEGKAALKASPVK
jgi:hypothetical protein